MMCKLRQAAPGADSPDYSAANRLLCRSIDVLHVFLTTCSRFGWQPFIGHNALLGTSNDGSKLHRFAAVAVRGLWTFNRPALLAVIVWGTCPGLHAQVGLPAGDGAGAGRQKADVVRLRKEAAHRQRRVIFNNDGNEAVYFPKHLPPTDENILALRTMPLVDSHVDTIFYCTNRGVGMVLHKSEFNQVLDWETREKAGAYADKRNVVGELAERGTDPLKIMVAFGRKHGKEIFWSMRMNDVHDAGNGAMLPDFKKDHPEYLFGSREAPPPYRG